MVNIASRADSGQWLVHEHQILLSTKCAWNKEGDAWSQRWLPYHLPEGYSRWTACENKDRTTAIKPRGFPQDVAALREHTLISRMHLNLNIQLSLSLAQQFLFKTFRASKIQPILHAFLSFFSRCTTLKRLNISFSIYEFYYLHRNLTRDQVLNYSLKR
jgi:hypothetical protein